MTDADLNEVIERLPRSSRLRRGTTTLRHRLLTGTGHPPVDRAKRWDEANIVEILAELPRGRRVLDAGAYNSPGAQAAARDRLNHVDAIDLNPRVTMSPRPTRVRYSCQNMMHTTFADGSFDVIFSGSTVEHGVDWDRWLDECRRLLVDDGVLYVSTDVVHEGVDTSSLFAFGLPWTPLTTDDIADMPRRFAEHGFHLDAVPIPVLPAELPVRFLGHDIGFVAFTASAN